MFEELQPAPADKILALIGLYRADPRPNKVDLGVGVYKDRDGKTPVMRAVREAEKRLLNSQDTKTYLGLAGDTGFNAVMAKLAFGPGADMLFAVVNLGRHLKLDSEAALSGTNEKFRSRFHYVEQALEKSGNTLEKATLDEMEALWQEAKSAT